MEGEKIHIEIIENIVPNLFACDVFFVVKAEKRKQSTFAYE